MNTHGLYISLPINKAQTYWISWCDCGASFPSARQSVGVDLITAHIAIAIQGGGRLTKEGSS